MKFIKTNIEGLCVIEPKVFEDERGYFYESYNENNFREAGIDCHWVQDNQARSNYGVIRGLHYQIGGYSQAKLVRAIEGTVLDVVLDIREDSSTYGQHFSIELSENNKKQLFVPRGLAHGYSVLTDTAIFYYKVDNFYNKQSEGGVYYADEQLAIDWKIPQDKMLLSEKDRVLPLLGEHKNCF